MTLDNPAEKKKNILNKIKDLFIGPSNQEPSTSTISAQELIDQSLDHFKMRLLRSSTDMYLLFPTSFVVYLNPVDFQERNQEFSDLAGGIKKKCLIYVNELIHTHPEWSDYQPHSKWWQIQFVEFKQDCIMATDSDKGFEVEMGHVMIVSDIYPRDYSSISSDSADKPSGGGRVVTTLHNAKGTTTPQDLAINWQRFKDITATGQNSYRLEFLSSDIEGRVVVREQRERELGREREKVKEKDVPRKENPVNPASGSAKLEICESYFLVDNKKTDNYVIGTGEVQITGPTANMSKDNVDVLRIDDDSIMNPHLNIRYDTDNQRFIISAVGDVKLNQRDLERNTGRWYDLPNNSTIMLNGDIQINFTVNNV